jgi:EAL domain-containing protein (putative c-di-GMP-specific phosphodiesterase class I)
MPRIRKARRQTNPFNTNGDVGFEFSFAFQPIVDARTREIISYEALVRGPHGEPSAAVFARVPESNRSKFDELCRRKAIYLASRLKIPNRLNLNMAPQSIYEVDLNITTTFRASVQSGIPVENIVFELLESESLTDQRNLLKYLLVLQGFGFKTAIDDFGVGYSGLKLLVQFQPNFIKLDRDIISSIHEDGVKQSVFSGIQHICQRLSIDIVAEGVETADEYHWLRDAGINVFQGYYFARPAFEALPDVADKVFSN